jgi:hypothetical protein
MPSARSIANLKPWPRGRSGNKAGRPKQAGPTMRDWQEFALEYPTGEAVGKEGSPLPTRDDTVMRTLYLIAIDRKHRDCVRAIIVWLERTRGKTPDRIDVGGKINVENEENPITTALEQAVAKLKRQEAAAADKDGR